MSAPYLYPLYCACCDRAIDPNGDHIKDDDNESVCSVECLQENNRAIWDFKIKPMEERE